MQKHKKCLCRNSLSRECKETLVFSSSNIFFLGLTLEPREEMLDPIIAWVVPYEQISIDQWKTASFVDGTSKVKNNILFGILWH